MSLITLFKAAVAGQRFRPTDFNQNMTDIENAVNGLDTSRVKNTTDETIAGVKTFSSSPVVPTPTTDMQASTKKYVDDKHALQVNLTGNQSVDGIKTFSSSPIVPTPTTDYQAATKKYVDDYAAPVGHVGSGGAAHADAIAGGADGFMTGADKAKLDGIETGAEVNNISDANATDLTDGGDTTLHTHDGRYYTETEINNLLTGYAQAAHLADNARHTSYASAAGTNDYAVTLSPVPVAYTPGMLVNFKAANTNTDISTLNCNGLGPVSIRKNVTGALDAGDIVTGQIVTVIYDGANFQIVSGSGGSGGDLAKIVALFNRVTTSGATGTVGIGIEGFEASEDTLLVYQNSTFILGSGNDYTVSGTDIVKPSGTWDAGTTFDFVVFKTVLAPDGGFSFTSPSNGQVVMFNSTNGLWENADLPAQTAANTTIADAGGRITATDVEAALQEIAGSGRTTEALSHIGLLASLTTTVKTTLVAAINELVTALGLKAPLASPTFTGTVVLPSATSIGSVSSTEIGYLDGVTSDIQTQLGAKAPLASPALTGTPTAPTATGATNTTQLATMAAVHAAIDADVGVANSADVKTALNASGSAPIYACRAWVNCVGVGGTINGSGNVSSVAHDAQGVWTVNFATALPDANYAIVGSTRYDATFLTFGQYQTLKSTTQAKIIVRNSSGVATNPDQMSIAVFR